MDEIDRAQIGQKREVAHEIIKHPSIPKTNLPPMKAIDKQDKSYWKSNNQWYRKKERVLSGQQSY